MRAAVLWELVVLRLGFEAAAPVAAISSFAAFGAMILFAVTVWGATRTE